ncbi:integral membrane sensor signal transduction histidine kinase [Paenibacillus curdlanolyticus YK9]|uniref:Oxygen sensor histidine kinase NreB n=1 Tax=Paenibacillus curdlanolyticus YK9 TaxID=717606 RepID=E0IBE9_9BACL|nr:sensor histidine kinase [Paenibacillus curdlanolyticus]EFM10029.1 integral membrane sensor signal transduction histidine kinase [Paenibacillus curdlanolyticus YK9]
MMVRLFRSGKLEIIALFAVSALLSAGSMYALRGWFSDVSGIKGFEFGLSVIGVILLVSSGFGYWTAQTIQRRVDALHLAIKQANNGNWAVRLPASGARSFEAVNTEFNEMAAMVEERLQLVQIAGEEQVMREMASNEAAVHEERKRLARDLHDTVSQQLFAIHMSASSLPKLLELRADHAAEVMKQLIAMSTTAQKQMRGFIAQLRPMELEGRSLQQALDKWFPDYCRQNQLQGEMDWRVIDPLSEAKEHQLFLIIQEAMANIVKHARAHRAVLTLSETDHQIIMTLQDDGVGFRPENVREGSYGLSTMRERAQKLGGDAILWSKPGGGTRIRVTIPKYTDKRGLMDDGDGEK